MNHDQQTTYAYRLSPLTGAVSAGNRSVQESDVYRSISFTVVGPQAHAPLFDDGNGQVTPEQQAELDRLERIISANEAEARRRVVESTKRLTDGTGS